MPYERSQEMELRFGKTLDLIRRKALNAGQLARELGISPPTMQRIITELRRRGYDIREVHDLSGWRYELGEDTRPASTNGGNRDQKKIKLTVIFPNTLFEKPRDGTSNYPP